MKKVLTLMAMSAAVAMAGDPVTAARQKHGDADYSIIFTAETENPIMIIDLGVDAASGGTGAMAQLPQGYKAMDRIQSHWVECPAGWAARFHSGEAGGYFISLVTADKQNALSKTRGAMTFRIHNLPMTQEIVNSGFNCTLDVTTFQMFSGKIK